jgi:formylglycine-generating enzyme required for sulfatase activity
MASQPPADVFPRARQLIQPFVSTVDDREALITEAFYTHDPILASIELEGKPKVFCVRLVRTLLDYGCIATNEHALARLLTTLRYDCGVDKHAEIDDLVGITNSGCGEEHPPAKSEPAPVTMRDAPVTSAPVTIDTPSEERKPTVFISYSHADTEFAEKLIADLNRAGHACWIDTTKIKGGDEWIMTIAEGIINSYAFVPLVTQRALQSKWVQDEILWARQKNKLIIPLIMEDVLAEKRFFPLISYQGVTLFDSDYDIALAKLLSYLPKPKLADVDVSEDEIDGDETIETIAIREPRAVPRKLELAYMERLQLEELLNTEKYTAMGGTSQQMHQRAEIRAVFELLPMGDKHEMSAEPEPFEDAVSEIQRIQRAVLLGEPGGGKTTTIWKLASDLVDKALDDRNAVIPLLIRLGKWTDATQPLHAFIASQLGDLGAYLDDLLREKRVALLLDGLNEIPASQHKAKYPQVQAFIEAYPDLLAVVSCRELDYTIDLGFDRINITPLDPLRIREFVTKYLDERGDDLFWKLAGDSARKQYSGFLKAVGDKLNEPEATFWIADVLPDGISWGYSWRDDWGNWLKEREQPSGLMVLARNPYMLLMLTSVYAKHGELPDNRGELFKEFVETLLERENVPDDEQDPLVHGLAQVAYAMQIRRADDSPHPQPLSQGERGADNALTVLPEDEVKGILGERLLYLAGSASILSVSEQVRFTHQLLQEYFAATYMDNEIKAGRLKASDIWIADSWWERTNWEEAAILLAGLYSDDPTPIVMWLKDIQPELAVQCITRSGASAPPDETLLHCREAWLPRLTNLEGDPDPRARVAVGRALGQLVLSHGECLDNREGVGVVRVEIVGTGRAPSDKETVQLPDIAWMTIPDDGEWVYQENKHKPLPTFRISKYPITYMQFQAFIDDGKGYHDKRWWQGFDMPDGHNDVPADQWFEFWNHPRERVSWFEAMAFCRWLSHKLWATGTSKGMSHYDPMNPATWLVRLPTEYEWEKAARGTQGFVYPYGNEFDASKDNTSETGLRQTSAVGMFPQSNSPYGVLDMSGNVFEWCLSDYNKPAETASDENIRSDSRRVLRGGSWRSNSFSAQCASRGPHNARHRNSYYGFRLVSSVVGEG